MKKMVPGQHEQRINLNKNTFTLQGAKGPSWPHRVIQWALRLIVDVCNQNFQKWPNLKSTHRSYALFQLEHTNMKNRLWDLSSYKWPRLKTHTQKSNPHCYIWLYFHLLVLISCPTYGFNTIDRMKWCYSSCWGPLRSFKGKHNILCSEKILQLNVTRHSSIEYNYALECN